MRSLLGRAILIVQRQWVIAQTLAAAFQVEGARVLFANNAHTGLPLADDPGLVAAVLDSESGAICRKLAKRNIPFILYTGRAHIDDECAEGPIVHKPTSSQEIVTRVKRLLCK